MNENLKTIKELAEEIGVSKTAINKKVTIENRKTWFTKIGNRFVINEVGQKAIKYMFLENIENQKSKTTNQNRKLKSQTENLENKKEPTGEYKYLLEIINYQKEQIKEPIQSEGSFDLAEKAIIKSVLEDMNLLEFVMDFLEPAMFLNQKEAYLKLLKGELEDPSLIRILLDNKIKAQDKEKLKQQMIMILYQYYEEQKQKVISKKQLSLREKSFLIRKYQKYLDNLKKGDLIVYEGFGAF